MKEIKEHASPDTLVYLIGNKAELEEEREITFDRAIEFAKANKISKCFETSAKTGNNVEDVFSCAIKEVFGTLVAPAETAQASSGGANQDAGKKTVSPGESLMLVGDNSGGKVKKDKKGCC